MAESTREWYLRAAREFADTSPRQVQWCRGVAADGELLELLDGLPRPARQPSLLFAVAAWLGAPDAAYPEWSGWLRAHADELCEALPGRAVQTNEPGRAAPLLVALARIRGPIALIELGASAGLCLLVERYGYRFASPDGEHRIGVGAPVLDCAVDDSALVPTRFPEIVWRRGVDRSPVHLDAAHELRWLEASLPPDRPDRLARLRAAIATAAADPPRVRRGDALTSLPALAAEAPAGATLVVACLGTAVYLPTVDRARVLSEIAAVGAIGVSFEARQALPTVARRWDALVEQGRARGDARFLLAVDGEPVAEGSAHGDRLSAVPPAGRPDAARAHT